MTAKSGLGNHTETGVLIGVIGLFSFAFLQTENMLVSLAWIVASIGWIGWWYERSNGSDREEGSQHDSLPAERLQETAASPVASTEPGAQKKPNRLLALFRRKEARTDTLSEAELSSPKTAFFGDMAAATADIVLDVCQIAEHITTARIEADQAVNAAVASFSELVEQAGSIETLSKEIMHWQEAVNPLYQPTISTLSSISGKLKVSVNQLVMAFQFNDLLSQRLMHTESSLQVVNARLRGDMTAQVTKSMSFAESAIDYTSEQNDDITLF